MVILATAGLELTQIPPEVGESEEVPFTQTEVEPENTMVGMALTVTRAEGLDTQPELCEVRTKAVCPGPRPVTRPELLTKAVLVLTEDQNPSSEPINCSVSPTQISLSFTVIVGLELTVTGSDGKELQPLAASVKINVAVPSEIAVTAPLFSMVAIAGFELTQVPPIVGLKVVSSPTQREEEPVKTVDGLMFTLTGAEASEAQLDPDSVNVKVALPAAKAVITP